MIKNKALSITALNNEIGGGKREICAECKKTLESIHHYIELTSEFQ